MEKTLWQEMGLTGEEYHKIVERLGREPNFVELGMFSVMWSEHCSYKHSKAQLRLLPTGGKRVMQGPGENAGVVDIGDGQAVAFKIESHNHPSAIEPYQGAATGVGGILRDIFTMGAQPVALLNSLRFGPLDSEKVRYLFDGVVEGIGSYGNCVGIPTVAGEIYFDDCYRENPLVNVMAVGIMPVEHLMRGQAAGIGNLVVLAGARTGRDGIHGVTFASEELSEASEAKRPAVQVGDPFVKKLLMEACLEVIREGLVVGVQDLGGAGLTCAVTETASRAGTGMEINLDNVPCREEGMSAYEIMLSESQERMLLILEKEKLEQVRTVFQRWDLPLTVLGRVTGDGAVKISYGEEEVACVPAAAVAGEAPECEMESREPEYYSRLRAWSHDTVADPGDYGKVLLNLLASPGISSKEWVYRRYDYMVRTSTVAGPGSGDAGVLRLRGTGRGLAVTVDGNGRQIYLDPYRGAVAAVAEATRNLSCTGAEPLGITDCLNFGNPEKPEIYWQFKEVIRGIADACRSLEVPVTGGNVSFYNEAGGTAIYPTPVIGSVGLLDDYRFHATMGFKTEGDIIILLGDQSPCLGGSEYLSVVHGLVAGAIPDLDLKKEKELQHLLRELIRQGLARSAHDLSEGGLAVALAECCIQGDLGARVRCEDTEGRADVYLFGEAPSRVLLTVSPDSVDRMTGMARLSGITVHYLGEVGSGSLSIAFNGLSLVDLPLSAITKNWKEAIPWAMQ